MSNVWKDLSATPCGSSANRRDFTAVVVLSLGLGIGANTAIFNIVNSMLVRPMPVDAPDRLVAIYGSTPSSAG